MKYEYNLEEATRKAELITAAFEDMKAKAEKWEALGKEMDYLFSLGWQMLDTDDFFAITKAVAKAYMKYPETQ